MLLPYEKENLIFIDTEFTSLDPYTGELLSIGIVKLSGESLYIELEFELERCNEWVRINIVPMLTEAKVSREEAMKQVQAFLGSSNPYAVAFVDNYDTIFLTKLFGVGNLPFRWMTIDMTSILFAIGINPVKFQSDASGAKHYYKRLGIDLNKYKAHHALDDAKLLRDVWLAITEKTTKPSA